MAETKYQPRLKAHYRDTVRKALTEQFGYKNAMEVPRIDKIALNMGIGEAVNDSKKVTSALADLALIAGQKPGVTKSRKSIATYKLRENIAIGDVHCRLLHCIDVRVVMGRSSRTVRAQLDLGP